MLRRRLKCVYARLRRAVAPSRSMRPPSSFETLANALWPAPQDEGGQAQRAALAAVILLQVVRDDLGVGVADRRAECLDHLGDLRIPQGRVGKRRVHRDVIEAVAARA